MPGRVFAADDDAFLVPTHMGPDFGRAISKSDPASAPAGTVGIRAVEEEVAVHGDFAGLKLDVHRLTAVLLRILDRLVKHVAFRFLAEVPSEMTMEM